MKKSILAVLGLAFGAAFCSPASATNAEGENAIGRAADRMGNPVRRTQKAHNTRNRTGIHPIHRLKHAHPIRRLEGR